jgi:hypothetical protein
MTAASVMPLSRRLLECIASTLVAGATATAPTLSPVGAEIAGNAAGTIPAWTGSLRKPPSGWQPAQGYVDPFAAERPLYTAPVANLQEQAERVAPGLQAVLTRNPAFRIPVYPAHRTAGYADRSKPRTALAGTDSHAKPGPVPFPEPRNRLEAISNHLLRDLGGGARQWRHHQGRLP